MTVEVYDGDGRLKRVALWTVSDAMYGPRIDARGNIYIMDMIKPLGEPYPKEFEGRLTTKRAPHWYNWIYGSVIKFGPDGGAIWYADGAASPLRYEGWRVTAENTVANLRTTGGSLRGDISKKTAEVSLPAAASMPRLKNRIVMRLKNEQRRRPGRAELSSGRREVREPGAAEGHPDQAQQRLHRIHVRHVRREGVEGRHPPAFSQSQRRGEGKLQPGLGADPGRQEPEEPGPSIRKTRARPSFPRR
jgi:hypothetical protein